MFAALGRAPATTSWTFVSEVSLQERTLPTQLDRSILPVRGTRAIGKKDMALNDTLPSIEIDPDRYTVTIDGERIVPKPASLLPLAQRYFLF
jgi:urease subunit alpha